MTFRYLKNTSIFYFQDLNRTTENYITIIINMTCSLNFLKEYSHAITSVCIKHGRAPLHYLQFQKRRAQRLKTWSQFSSEAAKLGLEPSLRTPRPVRLF